MDGRLGRRFVGHDERSRAYGIASALPSTVGRRPTFWAFPRGTSAPWDQQAEGACSAFSLAHELAAGPVQVSGLSAAWAHRFYRATQATDLAMGNDFTADGGGATMLAAAKTGKAQGVITGYRWAFGADQVVSALVNVGPVWLGIPWMSGSFETQSDGLIPVTGDVAGGHAICAVGYDEHRVHGPVVALVNSWGPSWGVADSRLNLRGGVGYMRVADLAILLAQDGEAVIAADYLKPPARRPWWARVLCR